jgi:hypothetical protein
MWWRTDWMAQLAACLACSTLCLVSPSLPSLPSVPQASSLCQRRGEMSLGGDGLCSSLTLDRGEPAQGHGNRCQGVQHDSSRAFWPPMRDKPPHSCWPLGSPVMKRQSWSELLWGPPEEQRWAPQWRRSISRAISQDVCPCSSASTSSEHTRRGQSRLPIV